MSILSQHDLPPTASFPQSPDNQFVPGLVFSKILKRKSNLRRYSKSLHAAIRREYHRTLIYSPSSVINRAAFVNSRVIYDGFHPTRGDKDSLTAAAKLFERVPPKSRQRNTPRYQALVPMLFRETSFDAAEISAHADYSIDREGLRALRHLLDYTGSSPDSYRPDVPGAHVEQAFRDYFSAKAGLPRDGAELLRRELFQDSEWSADMLPAFVKDLRTLGRWFVDQCDTPKLGREDAYKHFLIRRGGVVSNGDYGNPKRLHFPFHAKLLLDLRYVSNIPDQIGKITFTPHGFPSRSALLDFTSKSYRTGNDLGSLSARLKEQGRELLERAQGKFYTLPSLESLTLGDIVRIRESDRWIDFQDAQASILSANQSVPEFISATQNLPGAFEGLQRHIASVVRHRKLDDVGRRLRPSVSIAFSLGAGAITFMLTGNPAAGLGMYVVSQAAADLLQSQKGMAIKMLLRFQDKQGNVDPLLSTSIETHRDDVTYSVAEIRELIADATRIEGGPHTQTLAEIDNVD